MRRHVAVMTYAPALITPVLAAALAYALNLPHVLGAHPWWSHTVILIGLPFGLVLAAVLARFRVRRALSIGITGAAMLAAFFIATTGKARFAASYAEDALAGQMWYFGWIATCGLAAAVLATTLWPRRPAL